MHFKICASHGERERDLFFALCEYKSNLLPWWYIFSILYFPNTAFASGFGQRVVLFVLHLQWHAPLTTSGQAQASLQDQVPHLTEVFIFLVPVSIWASWQSQGEGISNSWDPWFAWQVLKYSVPIPCLFFFFSPKGPLLILTLVKSNLGCNPILSIFSQHYIHQPASWYRWCFSINSACKILGASNFSVVLETDKNRRPNYFPLQDGVVEDIK